MRDNWNHPSVAIWDASNETHWAFLKDKLIPAVRGLDLSNRPWENGYNLPQGPDDPYEWHPYKFIAYWSQTKPPYFEMSDLEKMTGANESREEGRWTHASIINEYDWLWLHRDGTPTTLARKVYEHLLGPDATPDQRRKACAYYLAGLTEFWRASREHAGSDVSGLSRRGLAPLLHLRQLLPTCGGRSSRRTSPTTWARHSSRWASTSTSGSRP